MSGLPMTFSVGLVYFLKAKFTLLCKLLHLHRYRTFYAALESPLLSQWLVGEAL